MRPTANSVHTVRHGAAVFGVFLLLMVVATRTGEVAVPVAATGVEREAAETPNRVATMAVPTTTTIDSTITVPETAVPETTVPAATMAIEEPAAATTTTTTTPTTTLRPLDPVTFESLGRIDTILDFTDFTTQGSSRWRRSIDGLVEFDLISTADGAEQPVLWLPPTGDRDQPVLVILHSWSSQYTQHAGIPFAKWAQENGWAVIAPEFRGKNDDANAVGSDLAVQDVADAIDFAVAQEGVDADRVFVVGYSGGGMMALLVAGQHPEKVAAVSSWGPPHDLIDFYTFSRSKGLGYWGDIGRACGGDPRTAGAAQDECLTRSPMTYMDTLREHEIPVFIGQGSRDPYVMRNAAVDVYNALADPYDRISDDEVDLLRRGMVPGEASEAVTIETHFEDRDPDPVFARKSGPVLLVYFEADHDMVYGAAAEWFASDPAYLWARLGSDPWD